MWLPGNTLIKFVFKEVDYAAAKILNNQFSIIIYFYTESREDRWFVNFNFFVICLYAR